MSAVRALAAMYLATASVFGVAIALSQHPTWHRAVDTAGSTLVAAADTHVLRPVAETSRVQLVRLFDAIDPPQRIATRSSRSSAARVAAAEPPRPTIERQIEIDRVLDRRGHWPRKQNVHANLPSIVSSAPPVAIVEDRARQPAANAPAVHGPAPPSAVAAIPPAPRLRPAFGGISPDVVRVVDRLKLNLTDEMLRDFSLFLYVSKAEDGPLAQHMYVFAKDKNGDLTLKYDWPVSTGRERVEFNAEGRRLPSFTPQGYYEIDPDRMYRHYVSTQWHEPMPYAMFFNWVKDGYKTGIAIHGATGDDIGQLGHRASAGCIRLDPRDARVLFSLIRTNYRGLAPRFAVNRRTGTMSNDGILLHNASGRVEMAEGYKVLIFIENYGGNDNVVAALF